MNIKIKRIDKTLPLPEYQTKGSVGFDLYAREKTVVQPFVPCLIPLNIIVKVPKGYLFLLASRSSLPIKKGLLIPNGVGIIDQDYCGEEDEIKLQVVNFTQKDVIVEKGERIAQGILVKISRPNLIEVEQMNKKSRGGFGSTG
ncbi:MAG: deoxyuridine 5'-triphosphate nucleotidohydrolase [Patescibacteria group bacterium]|nr:MAG: deoxyuridine 5'-triphosphate nucleotidohydrolase [Patescibacteria group bacterium]